MRSPASRVAILLVMTGLFSGTLVPDPSGNSPEVIVFITRKVECPLCLQGKVALIRALQEALVDVPIRMVVWMTEEPNHRRVHRWYDLLGLDLPLVLVPANEWGQLLDRHGPVDVLIRVPHDGGEVLALSGLAASDTQRLLEARRWILKHWLR